METIYYGKDGGFYSTLAHGHRTVFVETPVDQEGQEPSLEEVPNHLCTLPPAEDLVEITYARYQELMEAQTSGHVIRPGADGHPVAEQLEMSPDALANLVRSRRDRLLAEAALRIAPLQDAADLGQSTDSETAALLAWKRYRIELNRLENQPRYPVEVEWPAEPI